MVSSNNDVSRLFLQSVISRRVVSDKLARVLYRKCIEAVNATDDSPQIDYDPNEFDDFVNKVNASLQHVDLKLEWTHDETTGEIIWGWVNMKDDELAQVATDYTPVEIAYFKAVVEQIVLAPSESYSISTMAALREVNGLKPTVTKSQAEILLRSFVAKGWLFESSRKRFSLSSRTLLELQGYLKSNYEDDIHECTGCDKLVTKGIGCYVPACAARMHNHCYKSYCQESNSCRSCRSSWSDPQKLVIIGEDAARDGTDSSRRRIKKTYRSEEEESDGGEESESEPEPPQNTRQQKNGEGENKASQLLNCHSMSSLLSRRQLPQEDESNEDVSNNDDESSPPAKSQGRQQRR